MVTQRFMGCAFRVRLGATGQERTAGNRPMRAPCNVVEYISRAGRRHATMSLFTGLGTGESPLPHPLRQLPPGALTGTLMRIWPQPHGRAPVPHIDQARARWSLSWNAIPLSAAPFEKHLKIRSVPCRRRKCSRSRRPYCPALGWRRCIALSRASSKRHGWRRSTCRANRDGMSWPGNITTITSPAASAGACSISMGARATWSTLSPEGSRWRTTSCSSTAGAVTATSVPGATPDARARLHVAESGRPHAPTRRAMVS